MGVMLDGNIADVLLEDDILRNGLCDLVAIGAAEVFVTHVAIDEIIATPDVEKRDRLLHALFWVGARTIPTSTSIFDLSRYDLARYGDDATNELVDAYVEGSKSETEDALIAITAAAEGIPLTTADKRGRGRRNRHLPGLAVLSLADLRAAVNARLVAEGRLDQAQLALVQGIQAGTLGSDDAR